jgi:hypothetical protein
MGAHRGHRAEKGIKCKKRGDIGTHIEGTDAH